MGQLESQPSHFEMKIGHTQRTSRNRAILQREAGGVLVDNEAAGEV